MSFPPTKIELTGLGGIGGIGGSSILIKLDGVSVLLDCGIHAGKGGEQIPKALRDARPDVILLSHAHIDHIGAVPLVAKLNPDVPIFATEPTKKLAEPMLLDAMKIAAMEGHQVYTEEDIEKAVGSIRTVEFDKSFNFNGLTITFYRAGHILGAGMITMGGGFQITYTGDFSSTGTIVTPSPETTPKGTCDMLLCETTYGDRSILPRQEEESRFLKDVLTVVTQGGRVLIPSFALGRAQEVIALLVASMEKGDLPYLPIYLDGMVREVTQTYVGLKSWLSRPETARYLSDWRIVKPIESMLDRVTVIFGNEPCVIVASSGMLSGGWSPTYAKDVCTRKESAIFFVGYLDEESPGYKLREFAQKKVTLDDDEVSVLCAVKTFNLSAHAGAEGIMDLIAKVNPQVLVPIHGNPRARWRVAREAARLVGSVPIIPYDQQTLAIDLKTKQYELILSKEDGLAEEFLRSLKFPVANPDLADSLGSFADRHGITEYEELQAIAWSVFRLCGNYVSTSPWDTIKERSEFFNACRKLLFERYPNRVIGFVSSLEHTLSAFISNLVLYGSNKAWLDYLKKVDVNSLEEVQAIIVSCWNSFAFKRVVGIVDVYSKCLLRVQWPPDEMIDAKFDSIFSPLASLDSLLSPLPRWIKTIVIAGTVVGSYNNEVVLLVIPAGQETNADTLTRNRLERLQESRLFNMTGWKIDLERLKPMLVSDRHPVPEGMVAKCDYASRLIELVKPFGARAGGGTILAFSGLPRELGNLGLEVKLGPEFMQVTHVPLKIKLLVVVDASGDRFDRFRRVPGTVMGMDWFKFAIRKLTEYWDHKASRDQPGLNLATNVIAALGWRSGASEDSRRNALRRAVEVYEFIHVRNALRLLQNFWGKNPTHAKYSEIADADRLWLEKSYGNENLLEREVFKHEVRKFTGLQFLPAQYDRYIVVTPEP